MRTMGRLFFIILLPFIRFALRRTTRAYVVITSEGEVLLVKNWLGRQKLGLPGGGIRSNETPEKAISREVLEELNINLPPDQLKFIESGMWQTDGLGHSYHLFFINLDHKPTLKLKKSEIIDASWKRPEDLSLTNTYKEVLSSLGQVNLL